MGVKSTKGLLKPNTCEGKRLPSDDSADLAKSQPVQQGFPEYRLLDRHPASGKRPDPCAAMWFSHSLGSS